MSENQTEQSTQQEVETTSNRYDGFTTVDNSNSTEVKEEVAKESNEEEETAISDTEKEESTEAETEEEVKIERKKSRAHKKIDKQNGTIKDLKRVIGELEAKLKKVDGVEIEELDINDFDSTQEFKEALKAQEEAILKKEKAETKSEKAFDQDAVDEMMEYGAEDYEDFEEKINNDKLSITEQMVVFILDSESPHDVAYALANNVKLSNKIARLSKSGQQREIIKLELSLQNKNKVVNKLSKAPAPIEPLNGSKSAVQKDAKNASSYGEYERLRASQKNSLAGW